MFALAILANTMSLVFRTEGSFVYSMGLSVVSILFLTKFESFKTIRNLQIIFALFCLVLLLFSFIPASAPSAHTTVNQYLRWFLFAGVGSLLLSNYRYDFELLMKIIVIASLLMAPVITTTNYSRFDYDAGNDEWMMTIYAIIPLMVACLYYLFFGESKIVKALAVVGFSMYIPLFITHTSRGAVITILLAVFVQFVQKQIENGVRWRTIIIEFIVMIIFLFAFSELLTLYIQQVAFQFDLRWLSKFYHYEDISNGRTPLYQTALDGFINSPIWGNGIASFRNYKIYPHNLFLQMLYETGVLMFLPVSFLLYYSFLVMIKRKECIFDYRLITYLFIISIVQLFFSSFFWKRQQFWMLIWMMLFNVSILYKKNKL